MRIGRCCCKGHHLINIYCIELVENGEDIVNIQTTIDIKVQPEQRLTTAKLTLLGSLLLLLHVLHHLQPFHGHCQQLLHLARFVRGEGIAKGSLWCNWRQGGVGAGGWWSGGCR